MADEIALQDESASQDHLLPAEAAVQHLLDATNRSDRAGAESLSKVLGHLRLALDHAAAYCRSTGMDFAAYRKLACDLLEAAPDGAPEAVQLDSAVRATFALAIARVAKVCPASEKLMGLAAFWAPDRIPLSLFPADILTDDERAEAIAALIEVSLIAQDPLDDGAPGIAMHRLVQAAARGRLAEMGEHDNAAALATELVADAFPRGELGSDRGSDHGSDLGPDDTRTWPACARLMPHALAVLEHAPNIGAGAVRTSHLLSQAASYCMSRAAYADAEPLARRAVAILEQFEHDTGDRHPSHVIASERLAAVEAAMRGNGESEPLSGSEPETEPVQLPPTEAHAAELPLDTAEPDGITDMPETVAMTQTQEPVPVFADVPADGPACADGEAMPDLMTPPVPAAAAVAPAPPRPAGKATFLNWMFSRQ